MRFLYFLLLLFLPFQSLLAQVTLEGRVANKEGESLHNINILIYPKDRDVLIAFAVSDAHGRWQTTVNNVSDSLDIEASSVHYRNKRQRIANRPQTLLFELIDEVKELKTFTIKAPDIEQRGDTISYLVSSFALEHNRSIADVLHNMPGIEVEPSGRILYQGEPITRFYVEGLDLMGGRYAMVSNNMPHRSVATVEILENHQPLRILEERVPSYQAALNLKLKREIITTGTSKLGMGLTPILWDANVTPMTFTRKFQVVNSYQTNNVGNDAARQLTGLTLQEIRLGRTLPNENPQILGIPNLPDPAFKENRYLDNNIHLINSNALLRLNNDFQLRSNLYYINDRQLRQGRSNRTLYTPSDTLFFVESMENQLHDSYLQGEVTINRNIKKNYLNNRLRFNTRWDQRRNQHITNGQSTSQSIKTPFRSLANDLQSVNPIGNHLIEFNSFISFDHSPQQLIVKPGGFEHILHISDQPESLHQKLDLQRFFTDHSAGFTFGWEAVSIVPRLGFSYRNQNLDSKLLWRQNQQSIETPTDFSNTLKGIQTQTYLRTEIRYSKNTLAITAGLPVNWQKTSLEDQLWNKSQRSSRLLFDPSLSLNYQISGFWRIRGAWNYNNILGDIDEVHYGYILKNHQNLQQNAAPLSQIKRHNFSAFASYRNPINSFFNSISYIFSISDYNLISGNQVQTDGTTILQTLKQPNTGYSHYVSGQTSKYFSKAKTTLSLRASYSQNRRKSLLNQQLFETSNQFINIRPQINIRITNWLRTEYRAHLTYIQNYIESSLNRNISLLRHYLDFHAFAYKNHYVALSSEYYHHLDAKNLFMDLQYRFSMRKQRTEIELSWLNIFNKKNYTTYQASTFYVTESNYILRPSQIVLSIKFSF